MIYIGFTYPKQFKLTSKLIALWTKSNYSHVYVRFESSDSKVPSTVYHAAHGMVHFKTFDNLKKEVNVIKEYKIQVNEIFRRRLLIHCMELSGEKYGYIELAKIVISDIYNNIFKKHLKFKDSPGYICSELVGNFCELFLNVNFKKPLYLLTPRDIDNALMERTDG